MTTKKPTAKPKRAVPAILPREPMTQKAYKAIEAYALARCKGYTMYPLLIKFTLEAERMRRADLYTWLESHGYKWESKAGYGHWIEPAKKQPKADDKAQPT